MNPYLKLSLIVMLVMTALGTGWYIFIEIQENGAVSSAAWTVIAAVWFIVLRRFWLVYRQK